MKKAIIAISVLLIAAGASVGAFFAVKNKSDRETQSQMESEADNKLFSLNSDDIGKLEIVNGDGSYVIEKIDEKWTMTDTSADKFALNQTTIQGICTFISNLTAETSYGAADDSNKAKYGLDSPDIVRFYEGDTQHTLYIGDLSPTGEFYYAYTDEKSNIYALQLSDARMILTERLSLKDDSLVPIEDSSIVKLKLVRNGKTVYEISRENSGRIWQLPEEYSLLTVDQTRISGIITLITRLSAEEMYPEKPDDIPSYGFDKPTAEFIVTSADGEEYRFLTSSYGMSTSDYTLVYLPSCKQVEKYYTADLDFINYTPFSLIMQTLECADVYTTSAIELKCGDFSEDITINSADKTATCHGEMIDISNAELFSYFENFFNIFSYIRIADIDTAASPKLEEPLLSVKFTTSDGSVKKFDYVQADGDLCYIFADGKYTGSLASTDFISGSTNIESTYNLLCRQAGI